MSKGTWRGKPIEEYTKDELIEIVVNLNEQQKIDGDAHQKDLRVLSGECSTKNTG